MKRGWAWGWACLGAMLLPAAADALEIRYHEQTTKVNAFDPHGVVARRIKAPSPARLNRMKVYVAPPSRARYKDDVQPDWKVLGALRTKRPAHPKGQAAVSPAHAASNVPPKDARELQPSPLVGAEGGAVYRKLSELANTLNH